MSEAGERLLEGARDALAVAKGEKPAAAMYIAGHRYFPADDTRAAALIFYKWACQEVIDEGCRDDRSPLGCISCDTITAFERLAEILAIPGLGLPPR